MNVGAKKNKEEEFVEIIKSLESKIDDETDDTGVEGVMIAFARRIKSFNLSNINAFRLTNAISETIVTFVDKINDE